MQALASPNETYTHHSSIDDRRRAVNELIIAAYAGTSHEAPQGDAMRVAVNVWMAALDRAGVPSDALAEMLGRDLAERSNGFPPSVADITKQWRLYQASLPNKTIQQEDSERLQALPQGKDGPGRMAWLALGKRGAPVMCDCEPTQAAVLSTDSQLWICGAGFCGFSWPVNDTANAPAKGKRGPLFDAVRETSTDAEKAAKEIRKVAGGNHSAFLTAFSADAGVNLDACTPQQYVEFRQFAEWYKQSYPGCKVTPQLLAEEYPRFQRETAPEPTYV